MLLKPDCIPCILNMSLGYLRKLSLSEQHRNDMYTNILRLKPLRGENWEITSPEVIEPIMSDIMTAVDNDDPLAGEKEMQNQKLLAAYPDLKRMVAACAHPLRTAAQLAILGNAIDIMMVDGMADFQKIIHEQLANPLQENAYKVLEGRIMGSDSVLYFSDNAGEIVLDKLFIETIQAHRKTDITLVVRNIPALNDATLEDALKVGLNEIVRVVENGIDGPLPGTLLNRCSKEVNDLFQEADLVISKGGGNFDTLEEEQKKRKKKISYLLLSKCRPYREHFGVGMHRPILFNG